VPHAKELLYHNAICCGSYLFSVEGHFLELNNQSLPYCASRINNSLKHIPNGLRTLKSTW